MLRPVAASLQLVTAVFPLDVLTVCYARYGWTTQRNLLWILSELFVISCANAAIVGRWILMGLGVHNPSLSTAYLYISTFSWSLATTIMSGGMLSVDGAG